MKQKGFIHHHLCAIIKFNKRFCLLVSGAGFTLIELMVAVSIMAVLGTMAIAGFINYNQAQVLQASSSEVATMLNLAKSRAQSQIKPLSLCPSNSSLNGYTVVITAPMSYKLELNCSDGDDPVSEQNKKLPANLKFRASSSFFFPVQKGGVSAPGQIFISNLNESSQKIINVNSLGGVSVQ